MSQPVNLHDGPPLSAGAMPEDVGRGPSLPPAVEHLCRRHRYGRVLRADAVYGGAISHTQRIQTSSGVSLILKQSSEAPAGMYRGEAEGLGILAAAGALRTPAVHAVSDDVLLLEDLGSAQPTSGFWETFGRALATQHRTTSALFGWERDNYLGRLPQHNGRLDNGHTFFAERRILRYVSEPLCAQTLTARDRDSLERLCVRLPELIPTQPASLLHCDLWHANMLVGPLGEPAVIDPAVYYGWAEAELSMVRQCGNVPRAFFAAYNEAYPLEPGWWERLELLFVREILSMLAHFGDRYGSLAKLRAVLGRFD